MLYAAFFYKEDVVINLIGISFIFFKNTTYSIKTYSKQPLLDKIIKIFYMYLQTNQDCNGGLPFFLKSSV